MRIPHWIEKLLIKALIACSAVRLVSVVRCV